MRDGFEGKNPYMDYRNSVPFMNLAGFIMQQPILETERPIRSLKEYLFRKRFSGMVNMRRLRYKTLCEAYRNGRQ